MCMTPKGSLQSLFVDLENSLLNLNQELQSLSFSKKIERHFSTEGDITFSTILEFETFVISLKVSVSKKHV